MGFSKQCTKCGKVKWWYEFERAKAGKFSLNSYCFPCKRLRQNEYRKKNKDRENLRIKQYRNKNRDHISKRNREHRLDNIERYRERDRERRKKYLEKIKVTLWKYNQKPETKARRRELYLKNRNHILKRMKEWREKNPDKIKKYEKNKSEVVRKTLPDYYIKNGLCQKSNLKPSDIPQELVEFQRERIKLIRALKNSN